MSDAVAIAMRRIAALSDEIADLFLPGAKVTVYVRNPEKPGTDVLSTSDDIGEVLEAIQHRIAAKDSLHAEASAESFDRAN